MVKCVWHLLLPTDSLICAMAYQSMVYFQFHGVLTTQVVSTDFFLHDYFIMPICCQLTCMVILLAVCKSWNPTMQATLCNKLQNLLPEVERRYICILTNLSCLPPPPHMNDQKKKSCVLYKVVKMECSWRLTPYDQSLTPNILFPFPLEKILMLVSLLPVTTFSKKLNDGMIGVIQLCFLLIFKVVKSNLY